MEVKIPDRFEVKCIHHATCPGAQPHYIGNKFSRYATSGYAPAYCRYCRDYEPEPQPLQVEQKVIYLYRNVDKQSETKIPEIKGVEI